ITEGNIENFSYNNVIVGSDLAQNMNINIGDDIDLISSSGNDTVIGFIPRVKTFKVTALFKSGMYQYDNSTIIMPLDIAQTYFKLPNSVSLIELSIKDPYKSHITVNDLKNLLGFKYKIEDWQIINKSYFNILKTERIVMFFILTLIIIVASFNTISSLIMLVRDKNKDIAILRTIGATKYSILKIFMICGSLIGFIGTFLGVLIGLCFALNIESIRKYLENITGNTIFDPVVYYLSSLPIDIRLENVATVVIVSILLSFIATIYPAYSASSINPAEGTKS
ncbi:MAG: FtsX-like permease family protein, partial [Rickettsiales bacterium]